jgi:hypothetical protein
MVKADAAGALARLEQAARMLAEVRTAGEAVELRQQARAVEVYLRQQEYAKEAALDAAEIRLRAERRAGEILAATVNHGGSRGVGSRVEPTLPEGIGKKQSHLWQRGASLPEADFERVLAEGRKAGELTTSAVVQAARRRADEAEARGRAARAAAAAAGLDDDEPIYLGDFRAGLARVPEGSVSLIFTDPPYDGDSVPLYGDLAEAARRVLRPGGSLLCYAGVHALPEVMGLLGRHLDYYWTVCCVSRGFDRPGTPLPLLRGHGIRSGWKPILWFTNGPRTPHERRGFVFDAVSGGKEKGLHEWQQAEAEAAYYIEALTDAGEVVCDPLCGTGTTAAAAAALGRRFVGCEADPLRCRDARARLAARLRPGSAAG